MSTHYTWEIALPDQGLDKEVNKYVKKEFRKETTGLNIKKQQPLTLGTTWDSKHGLRSINKAIARRRWLLITTRTTTRTKGCNHGFRSIIRPIVSFMASQGKTAEQLTSSWIFEYKLCCKTDATIGSSQLFADF
ncbi:uncharacterized protein LOC143362246 [Halictus rubicundus]|uniref:uncharacterized protein LOC143362246 n=1 Tax=Halictus rubicundus TaxID=77578 RepID=UPI0040355E06